MLRIWKLARGLVAAIGCWWLLATLSPVNQWWAARLAQPWDPEMDADVLVALGGDSLGDSVLGSSSYWRSVYTVRAIRQHKYTRVILSGTPAESMREFLKGNGIDIGNVIVETESASTIENASHVKPLLGDAKSVVLLTSDYHTWRASRVFRKKGIAVRTNPVPDALKRNNIWHARAGLFIELSIETVKIGWYQWKGWI